MARPELKEMRLNSKDGLGESDALRKFSRVTVFGILETS